MKNISEQQVQDILTVERVLPEIRKTYLDCAAGDIYAGERLFLPIRGEDCTGQWLTACSLTKPFFGTKFSSVFPTNLKIGLPSVISTISLYSAVTGQLEAMIDANYLTAIKTAGSAAVATDLMARKDATSLAIIGTGFQAFSQVRAIQAVRELQTLYVYDMFPECVERFIGMIRDIQNRPYEIIAAKSGEDCVKNADIICTCTTSRTPVFPGSALKPGAHVNAIGSFTDAMQEIDVTTVQRAERVITEHVDGLWQAAGDILIPFRAGEITEDKVSGSVADVLNGTIPGRERDDQITLYESVGSGVLDIALSIVVYEELEGKE